MNIQKKAIPFTVFFVVANPCTFQLTRKILGNWVASADGLPTTAGLLLHALVFVLLAHFLWKLVWGSKKSSYRLASDMEGDDSNALYMASANKAVQGKGMRPGDLDEC
jgi:hypothetical protein